MARSTLGRSHYSWTAALAVAAVAVTLPTTALAQFTSLTVFGDSFSDTGNGLVLSGGTQPASPPYFPGRASNGLIWVDYLADDLGLPAGALPAFVPQFDQGSYAVGTARTVAGPTSPAPSTEQQIGRYLARPGGGPSDATGLYVLFAGANDVADAAFFQPTDAARIAAAQAAAANLGAQAAALATSGAGTILIPFLPDIGRSPLAMGIPGASPILSELTGVFNAALAGQLATLRGTHAGTDFLELSLDNLFENILLDAQTGGSRYGLTNATTPCLSAFLPPGAPVPDCDVSVFADLQHPTTAAHRLIADAVYDRAVHGVDVQVVPEPATLALVGGGLLLLGAGAVRRRQRAA